MNKEGIECISDFARIMKSDEYIIRIMNQNYIPVISKEDFDSIELPENMDGFYCEFTGADIIEAYSPFLTVLKELINKYEYNIDDLLEETHIYRLLRNVFKSYIESGIVRRTEKILLSERDYEKEKFINGLVDLLMRVTQEHGAFILINGMNQICESTLSVLEKLFELKSNNFKILTITSDTGTVKQYMAARYNNFIEKNDMKGLLIDAALKDNESDRKKEQTFVFKNSFAELTKIDVMFHTFAIEQADYYMSLIYQKVELEKVYVTLDFRIKMLTLYISICIFRENYSMALMLCDKFKAFNGRETERKYQYYYYGALANVYFGNVKEAIEMADKCLEITEKIGDEYLIFSAMIIQNMVRFSGWKDIWICSEGVEVPEKLLKLCKKYNCMNHLAHILVYSYHNSMDIYSKPDDIEKRIPKTLMGIDIASKLENYAFVIEAYRKCVMMASYNGNFDTASYFYKKSIEVVKETKNLNEEADIYNGMGYDCCTADKFAEANEYYNKALEIFFKLNNTDAVMETLYNMGTNALLAGDYGGAEGYLTAVANILRVLKKENIRICNISKILALISIATYKIGNMYVAQVYNSKTRQFLNHILEYRVEDFENYLWGDDVFLYYYSCALICMNSNRLEDALALFDKSERFLKMSTGSKFMNLIFYSLDKARTLRMLGREEEAVALLKEALEFYEKRGNPVRIKMLQAEIDNTQCEYVPQKMEMSNMDVGQIIEFVRLKEVENELKATKKQLEFFGTFQELVNGEYMSLEHMISTLVANFKMNFKLDNVLFIDFDDDQEKIKYCDLEYKPDKEKLKTLINYFDKDTDGFVLSKFSNNYDDFKGLVDMFDKSKISSIIVAPIYRFEKLKSLFITFNRLTDSWNLSSNREVLDEKDRDIFMIIFRQIVDAIDKYKLNQKLKVQAITDELTGLYNRNGYYRIINREVQRARKENRALDVTIMYMDLDHFKYYNDTFGHHVGDELLRKFAEIFKNACEDYGEAIRFGGDEFIIIVNNAEKDIVKSIVKNIYDAIEEEKGFEKFVEQFNDEENVNIPKNYHVTCSIGIDMKRGIVSREDYSILRKHADAALYYGKKTTRGRAIWYEEMEKLKNDRK